MSSKLFSGLNVGMPQQREEDAIPNFFVVGERTVDLFPLEQYKKEPPVGLFPFARRPAHKIGPDISV